jgi:hypothetical protein
MKSLILIFRLIATTSAIHAQLPQIKIINNGEIHTYSYKKGGDSLRLTIIGTNDTVQETVYYRNGKPQSMVWKNDSFFAFNTFGRAIKKHFGFKKRYDDADSSCIYYANGQLQKVNVVKNGVTTQRTYARDGRLKSTNIKTNGVKVFTEKTANQNGVVVESLRTDTIEIDKKGASFTYDTIFYPNSRPFRIRKQKEFWQSVTKHYREDGTLVKSVSPDSTTLIIFKDNVDCNYGLRNPKGDTVVKPHFDRILIYEDDFFVAYEGEFIVLLDKKGAPMTPPADKISKITQLNQLQSSSGFESSEDGQLKSRYSLDFLNRTNYYCVETNGKFGVMSNTAALIMPPQYFYINYCLIDTHLFMGSETHKDSSYKSVVVNRQGVLVFPKEFESIAPMNYSRYFKLSPDANSNYGNLSYRKNEMKMPLSDKEASEMAAENKLILGEANLGVIVSAKFYSIERIGNTSIFAMRVYKKMGTNPYFDIVTGLFDAPKKRWLLEANHFAIDNAATKQEIFVVKDLLTKKMGIMDTTGAYVLPISVDSIGVADETKGLFWIKKGEKYQILNIVKSKVKIHKPKYDYLVNVNFVDYQFDEKDTITYFVAKRNDFWGVVDAKDSIVMPFNIDYVSLNLNAFPELTLAKNGQANRYDVTSFPNPTTWLPNWNSEVNDTHFTQSFGLIENKQREFFTTETGKIIVPPLYKLLYNDELNNLSIMEDDQKNKKLVFFPTGKVVDYPFRYAIKSADAQSRVIVVSDSTQTGIGVVSTSGKVLVPCINYAATIGDAENSVFFVKRDTPITKDNYYEYQSMYSPYKRDSLDDEDTDWQMFDGNGKQLSDKPFRFAINLKQGVGIGMQDAGFNLYKSDGTILAPFRKNTEGSPKNNTPTLPSNGSYVNIRREVQNGFYALFYNQGLTPTMQLTNRDGSLLVKSGHYDGISRFYGKYALVTAANKVGLIDSFGREIIAPKDLRSYDGHFMDSLNLVNADYDKDVETQGFSRHTLIPQPITFPQYVFMENQLNQSSITPVQRNTLWNLALEKTFKSTIMTASDIKIQHILTNRDTRLTDKLDRSPYENIHHAAHYVIEDSSCAFALQNRGYSISKNEDFYNFYHRDNRWNELKINDLLNIQGDKRWQMNDLITKKVKALKDEQIDCSNAAAFITTVENRWMLTKNGVDFCFDSTGDGGDLVIISFTWAELTPFLKLRIY